MSAELILRSLPSDIQWLVLFRLSKIREITDEGTVKAMFFLPQDTVLDDYSFVTLSSLGTLLLQKDSSELLNISFNSKTSNPDSTSVFELYQDSLAELTYDDPDCIGLGSRKPMPLVIVSMEIQDGIASAETILQSKPDFRNYELLKAIGVSFNGGEERAGKYYARFENKLPSHIHSGILAHFTRTDNCNQFYFNHCNIDPFIESGLIKAANARIKASRDKVLEKVIQCANDLPEKVSTLTCIPPSPAMEFPYGDIVPYGFLLKALSPEFQKDFTSFFDEREKIISYLKENTQAGLWAYGRGGLATATDSALVLMGYYLPGSVELMEKYSDGKGGYIPQLCAEEPKDGYMKKDVSNDHWCDTDIATTYLIMSLRHIAGLPPTTTGDFIRETFDKRKGIFFANPYMTDYFLAMALKGDTDNEVLKDKLKNEILSSINSDYSFGKFDIPLSTAFAVLSLSELGFNNRMLALSQLKLLDFLSENTVASIPFFSTLKIDQKKFSPSQITSMIFHNNGSQIFEKEGDYYAVTFYEDRERIITNSIISMALSVRSDPSINDTDQLEQNFDKKDIYNCKNHKDYCKLIS